MNQTDVYYLPPKSFQIFTYAATYIICIAAATTNALIILAFIINEHLRKRNTYFILNLAISDFLFGSVLAPMFAEYLRKVILPLSSPEVPRRYLLGDQTEKIVVMIGFLTSAHLTTLMLISLDRMFATVWPLRHRQIHPRMYYISSVVTWFLSGVLIGLAFLDLILGESVFACWGLMCLAVMAVSYATIFLKVKKQHCIHHNQYRNNNNHQHQQQQQQKQRQQQPHPQQQRQQPLPQQQRQQQPLPQEQRQQQPLPQQQRQQQPLPQEQRQQQPLPQEQRQQQPLPQQQRQQQPLPQEQRQQQPLPQQQRQQQQSLPQEQRQQQPLPQQQQQHQQQRQQQPLPQEKRQQQPLPQQQNVGPDTAIQKERRLAKTLLLVTITSLLTWLPLLATAAQAVTSGPPQGVAHFLANLIFGLSPLLDPVIYLFRVNEYRLAVVRVVCGCQRYRRPYVQPMVAARM